MGKPKTFELVVSWTRWTAGIAWQYHRNKYGDWTFELSVQIPVVAVSIYLEHSNL